MLCSAKAGEVMSVISRGRVKVDKVSASAIEVSAEVGKIRILGGKSKVAKSDVSGAKVDQEALCYASESNEMHKFEPIRGLLDIASGSCPKVDIDVHKFGDWFSSCVSNLHRRHVESVISPIATHKITWYLPPLLSAELSPSISSLDLVLSPI